MSGFDAELYLRRLGEDALLGTVDRDGDLPALDDIAAALVAVDAIELERAHTVLADYQAASVARGGYDGYLHRQPYAPHPERPAVRRVVPLGAKLDLPGGVLRLRYVVLAEGSTEISAVFTARPGTAARAPFLSHPSAYPPGLVASTLTDDRGTSTSLDFSGGDIDDRWHATLTAQRPIAQDTSWIELYGRRIPLTRAAVPATVAVEPTPTIDPAHRHLWRAVALAPEYGRDRELTQIVAAMVAAGTLAVDDPEIERAHRVRRAISTYHGPGGPGNVRGAPEPWPSLLRRAGRVDGPKGMIVMGAVAPEFGRHFAAIHCLESSAYSFRIDAAVSPPDIRAPAGVVDLEQRTLIWWARDDCGNHYLGNWIDAHGEDEVGSGTLGFMPALDPRATRLEVLPTALRERAVIGFPLTGLKGRA